MRPGEPVLVTFRAPFPRGSLTAAGLSTLRVIRHGSEIPAFVGQLTSWRHRRDAALGADRAILTWDSVLPGYGSGSLTLQRLYGLAGRACG